MYLLLIIASILPFCLGRCLNPQVVQNFNASAYSGKWYEQAMNPSFFERGGSCTTAEYTLMDDGTIKVLNNMFIGQDPSSTEGSAAIVSKNGEAKLEVTYTEPITSHSPYWVISTDYTSYAVVYSCSDIFGITYSSTAWILTREQNPPESLIQNAYVILKEQNIKTDDMKKTDQNNCH